jgi:hypothetical protein
MQFCKKLTRQSWPKFELAAVPGRQPQVTVQIPARGIVTGGQRRATARGACAWSPDSAAPDAPLNIDDVRRNLLFEQLVPIGEKREEEGAHVIRRERYEIAGLEPVRRQRS